jgi:hypothetical protein
LLKGIAGVKEEVMKVPSTDRPCLAPLLLLLMLFSPRLASAGPTFYGPSPYLSPADSPFAGLSFEYEFREDFEDGQLNTPGVSASAGSVGPPSAFADSVDTDDGSLDGNGNRGWALFSHVSQGFTFTFDAAVLGHLPTHAGVVWTDAESPRTTSVFLESFDAKGSSSGFFGPFVVGDSTTRGTTLEDRFLGVSDPGGISAIRIFHQAAQIEVDHLQYGWMTPCEGDPCITGLTPRSGGDTGSVTVRITGQGFSPGATVKLTRAGYPDILGDPVTAEEDGSAIKATFNLSDQVRGIWDVKIVLLSAESATLNNGFTVEEGRPLPLWLQIIGRDPVQVGRETRFVVLAGNSGNVDARNSRIAVGIWENSPLSATAGGPLSWVLLPVSSIPPGASIAGQLALSAPRQGCYDVNAVALANAPQISCDFVRQKLVELRRNLQEAEDDLARNQANLDRVCQELQERPNDPDLLVLKEEFQVAVRNLGR